MASEFNIAQQKLQDALQEFQRVCANDRMFEAEVKKLVDTVQPYVLGGHYSRKPLTEANSLASMRHSW